MIERRDEQAWEEESGGPCGHAVFAVPHWTSKWRCQVRLLDMWLWNLRERIYLEIEI